MEWHLQSDQAFFEENHWRVDLDPRAPDAGLKIRFGSTPLGQFLKVAPKPSHSFTIREAYVRQDDLIVRYEQASNDLFTLQLNWRRLECEIPDALAVELWISVQTSLLDSHPTIEIRSRAPGAAWHGLSLDDLSMEKSTETAIGLVKMSGVTAMVMIEPSDAHQARRIVDRSDDFAFTMLGEFMEKGVIRRARLRLVAVSTEIARSKIVKQFRAFTDSPLPLTA